jgi:serine/threonine-protein kinase
VVHRDVSPNNILLSSEGEVKLADFGLAKAAHYLEGREGDQVVGRVEYMAPEQACGQITDGRSDLFSLGVVFYELLSGRNPFREEGDSLSDTLTRLLSGRVPLPLIHLPNETRAILERCLAGDRQERYESAGKLGYDLEYSMYHKGYGPTIQTLARYLRQLTPLKKAG